MAVKHGLSKRLRVVENRVRGIYQEQCFSNGFPHNLTVPQDIVRGFETNRGINT
jgi:hypothetical protein